MAVVGQWRETWRGGASRSEVSPRPTTPAGPPIWLAAHGPRMLRLAGASFEGWLPFSPSPAAYREGLEQVRLAAGAAGRRPEDITAGVYLTVAIGSSTAGAQEDLEVYM